jgi:ParB family chromosome partitioning protein
MGHARALLSLEPAQQIMLANKVVLEGLSVREAETLVQKQGYVAQKESAKPKTVNRDTERLQEELAEKIGARVEIKTGKKGNGKLVIEYASNDHLDELITRLTRAG